MQVNTLRFGVLRLSMYKDDKLSLGMATLDFNQGTRDLVTVNIPYVGERPLGHSNTAEELHNTFLFYWDKLPELRQKLAKLLGPASDLDMTQGDPEAIAHFGAIRETLEKSLVNGYDTMFNNAGFDGWHTLSAKPTGE